MKEDNYITILVNFMKINERIAFTTGDFYLGQFGIF